jgi:hypothetical protein
VLERTSGGGGPQEVDRGGGSVTWKPRDENHEAAAGEWIVGDRVTARANAIKVRTRRRGTVVGFSSVGGHPLVDFAGSGLVLIRAEHLARDDDSTTEVRSPSSPRSPGTTRLSDTPRPPTVAALPPPPPPDWFDRPPQLQVPNGKAFPTQLSNENLTP